ncbi:MAG TPA: alginate export family protein [Terriglobales bacterium]|nr:alginate export family protein [Terriglobales bacterium]
MSLRRLVAIVILSLTSAPICAAQITIDRLSEKLSLGASLRTRWEGWNWFQPHGTQNNDYDFIGTMARASLRWKDEAFDVFVEAQNSALIDLPTTATAPAPQGALGLGGTYFVHNRKRNDAGLFLKQGFLNIKRLGLPGASLKLGRFEFAEGNEVLSGEPTMDWLKNIRISQRLIGPFVWSHVGRAFDGGVFRWNQAPLNLTMMLSRPTAGGFDLDGMDQLEDVEVAYTGFTHTDLDTHGVSDARLFYTYYGDRRHQTKTDNRSLTVRNDARERLADVEVHTGGAHLAYVRLSDAGTFDAMTWAAFQGGRWGRLDHAAWAVDGEIGWQPKLPGKPWLRAGYSRGSGDGDPDDDEHGTFFQMLPTARLYSFSTFYNMMNSEDAFVQLILRPTAGLLWRTDFHNLRISEGKDLWYQGSGATIPDRDRPEGFGYTGRPANGRRNLFQLVETTLSYDWTSYLNTNLYYTHVFGGAAVEEIFAGDDADFGYLEIVLKL